MYIASKISPVIERNFHSFEQLAKKNTIWKNDIDILSHQARIPQNEDDFFLLMHKKQHIEMIHAAALENRQDLFFDYKNNLLKKWDRFRTSDADLELQTTLGRRLFQGDPNQGDKPLIRISEYAGPVAHEVLRQNVKYQCDFDVFIEDYDLTDYMKSKASEKGNFSIGAYKGEKYNYCNRVIGILNGVLEKPAINIDPSEAQNAAYKKGFAKGDQRMLHGLFYTLTAMPTHEDAKTAGFDYSDLTQMFFEMADQPDTQKSIAQEKMIAKFDMAKELRITNSDGTDIRMNLYDENGPFTFANSMTAKNNPGSEFFSAPAKYSVNGRIVAKGRFIGELNDYDIIEDITLDFDQGRIIAYDAEKGLNTLRKNIEHDDGTHYLGEVAFGTNAACKKHIANPFMCEKIGGSFHVAIGNCFKYTQYCGKPVRLDNGNASKDGFHWDITTMLHGKNGCVELDGAPVMENGLWLGNEFDVLNRGWEAIPFEQRPPYWQKKFPQP